MAKGLPKDIIAKYGISKKAWQVYRSRYKKVYKGGKAKTRVVRKLARRRSYRRKTRKRRVKRKIPLEVAVALGAVPFTPPTEGFASIFDSARNGDYVGVADALKSGFLGMDGGRGTPNLDLFRALNPFDLGCARYTKMIIFAGLLSKIRKAAIKLPLDKVPIIGKYIS